MEIAAAKSVPLIALFFGKNYINISSQQDFWSHIRWNQQQSTSLLEKQKMSIEYSFCISLIIQYICYARADCCGKTGFRFINYVEDRECSHYHGAFSANDDIVCSIAVCGNGRPPGKGVYCGIGSCNWLGCNCEGGCVPGDGRESFARTFGNDVEICYETCHLRS